MQTKNFDGIKKPDNQSKKAAQRIIKKISIDAIARRETSFDRRFQKLRPRFAYSSLAALKNFSVFKPLPYLIAAVVLMAFGAGSYLTWRTDKSLARDENPVPTASSLPLPAPKLPVVESAAALGPINQIPNEVLFNLTLDQLEIYLAEALKTPAMKAAEKLAVRKEKLKEYLKEKRSPFVEIVNTLAELKHWKLVLAVSNSESTLGKRCYNNNCSGIGVEPGHPLWREYKNKAEWAKDLDRLIEKRYKDWTLEEMNGVYNKPGSQNWLLASKQILEELQERGIE